MREPENRKRPSGGRSLWEWWKQIGKRIGDIQARILLVVFYFVVLGPFALAVRWGSDPLGIKPGAPRGWRDPRDDEKCAQLERATRQF